MAEKTTQMKRTLRGTVVSDKMDKTVVVRVDSTKVHPKYGKRFTRSRKFKAHDEKGEYKTGDVVKIQEIRPLSKEKCWRVVGKVNV